MKAAGSATPAFIVSVLLAPAVDNQEVEAEQGGGRGEGTGKGGERERRRALQTRGTAAGRCREAGSAPWATPAPPGNPSLALTQQHGARELED